MGKIITQDAVSELANILRKAEEPNLGVSATPEKAADDFLLHPNTSPHPESPVGSGVGIPKIGQKMDKCIMCGKGSDCACLDQLHKGELKKEHIGFEKLKNELAHKKGVTNPAAVAAHIGFEKYGKKGMEAKAHAGKTHKSESPLLKRSMKKDMMDSPAMGDSQGSMYMSEDPQAKELMGKAEFLSKPPVSQAQRAAMGAAASGHSTLGIPKSVGKEFIDADKGGKLPVHKALEASEEMGKAEESSKLDWREMVKHGKQSRKEKGEGSRAKTIHHSAYATNTPKSTPKYHNEPDVGEYTVSTDKKPHLNFYHTRTGHQHLGQHESLEAAKAAAEKHHEAMKSEEDVQKGEDMIDMAHEADHKLRLKEFAAPHEGVVPDDQDAKKEIKASKGNEGPVVKLTDKKDNWTQDENPFQKAEWTAKSEDESSHTENNHEMSVKKNLNKGYGADYVNKSSGYCKSSTDHKTKEDAMKSAEKAKLDFVAHKVKTTKSELNFNKMGKDLYRAETAKAKYEIKKEDHDGYGLYASEDCKGVYSSPEVAMEKAHEMHKSFIIDGTMKAEDEGNGAKKTHYVSIRVEGASKPVRTEGPFTFEQANTRADHHRHIIKQNGGTHKVEIHNTIKKTEMSVPMAKPPKMAVPKPPKMGGVGPMGMNKSESPLMKRKMAKGLFGSPSPKAPFKPAFQGHKQALGVGSSTNAKGVTTSTNFDPLSQKVSNKKTMDAPPATYKSEKEVGKAKYETCPDCEANFKLPADGTFPEHKFLGKRCEKSGKSVK